MLARRALGEAIARLENVSVDLVLSEARIDYMQRLNMAVGVQDRLLPFAEVADMSLARDALKLL